MSRTSKKYCDKCNELYFSRNGKWFEVEHRKWRQDRYTICFDKTKSTVLGHIRFSEGRVYDGASVVGDTDYAYFWQEFLIHDESRRQWRRILSDANFALGMFHGAFQIYKDLIKLGCPQAKAVKELVRLLRKACIYFLGVSGVIGSMYIGVSSLFKFDKKK